MNGEFSKGFSDLLFVVVPSPDDMRIPALDCTFDDGSCGTEVLTMDPRRSLIRSNAVKSKNVEFPFVCGSTHPDSLESKLVRDVPSTVSNVDMLLSQETDKRRRPTK